MEGRLPAKFAFVGGEDRGEVEGGDGVQEEGDEVALGEPVVGRGWEEVGLVGGPIAIRLVHPTLGPGRRRFWDGPRDYSNVMSRRQYSDRLLGIIRTDSTSREESLPCSTRVGRL